MGKDSYLLRTLFGWDTDIVQVLNRYRTDPEQELLGQLSINSRSRTLHIRRWYEHNTKTTRRQH
ncbi:hypothetical protein [Sphingobacterium sp. UME9]|uniref:hypothetical protein n=1 Tax=Sphingobacterium sp. UME9 TaxID=1862316 RepID=UPI0015FF4B26|nr:hypothetical protein [Sphingobacterium sp. UME9]